MAARLGGPRPARFEAPQGQWGLLAVTLLLLASPLPMLCAGPPTATDVAEECKVAAVAYRSYVAEYRRSFPGHDQFCVEPQVGQIGTDIPMDCARQLDQFPNVPQHPGERCEIRLSRTRFLDFSRQVAKIHVSNRRLVFSCGPVLIMSRHGKTWTVVDSYRPCV